MRKQTVSIQLPTDPQYWGTHVNATDVDQLCGRLESMIRTEFGDCVNLEFDRTPTPRGGGVHCEHEATAQDVWNWIANNWTAAL